MLRRLLNADADAQMGYLGKSMLFRLFPSHVSALFSRPSPFCSPQRLGCVVPMTNTARSLYKPLQVQQALDILVLAWQTPRRMRDWYSLANLPDIADVAIDACGRRA